MLINFGLVFLVFQIRLGFVSSSSSLERRARLIQLHGRPKAFNTRDRLTTRLISVGTHPQSRKDKIIYTSIASNEECLLKKFEKREERCEVLPKKECNEGNY